ncbi:FAD-dependent oxidoreductase [Mariniblastus fucicola]|uniref:Deoxyribodipyrimidine photo-lyase n=1 Tax=Mariniblastus fucicola TaxID=980251 RepID=A0A5B9PDZ2_9BACT|nr:FAD-dependent oxidoreductase [Mariniblastus fucicola]QEG23709.1 Deoxyribodipyrimidine photo-lyase [Mariniblastus fucicola]
MEQALNSDLTQTLPPHLLERTRVVQEGDRQGKFVLYWMRTAVRADENPAIDVAILLAKELDLPLLVYQAISQHYQYASDRHHTFMLEGARDVQQQFRERGISYAFHLATPDDDQPHLITLGRDAAVVVTEEMPVDPPRRFLRALSGQIETLTLCVDTACIVPMQLVQKAHTRAFEFRSATRELYESRLGRPWPAIEDSTNRDRPKQFDLEDLPFEPVDLQARRLSELVAACAIDHSVGPIQDTVGGSKAGYERWVQFREHGMSRYARQRNNALLDGVSRMSAYLHYGMVSPFRIARETAQVCNAGSEKYLDELLIWREMAYGFCFHRSDHDQWSAIPNWAQETLEEHLRDPRESIYSWEELARAQTDDALWNAAQRSLLRQGELHNNVRMTWGKAILNWTETPQRALEFMIDLNHRYALDGRDPASYGGLLWCIGQFDRPFKPASKIFGTVRSRSTSDHAKRLDVAKFHQKVSALRFDPVPRVAVIGAGISGLFAARTLADHGVPVTVFDKGRGVGGRMSTRRIDGVQRFDHGAQYFTVRDARFRRYVDSWIEQGIVGRWPNPECEASHQIAVFNNGEKSIKQDSNERFVGQPGMNSICKHLASGLDVQTSTRVGRIEARESAMRLFRDDGDLLGRFDRLIVSAPAKQTAELLRQYPEICGAIRNIRMNPCWAVMASFTEPIADDWVGAFVHESILTWVSRNSSKPARQKQSEDLVLHLGHEWTAENWDRDPEEVAEIALDAFWKCSAIAARSPTLLRAHRWKFAIPENPAQSRCFFDPQAGIAACGDWAGGPRVEGAFLSGMSAAGRILNSIGRLKY